VVFTRRIWSASRFFSLGLVLIFLISLPGVLTSSEASANPSNLYVTVSGQDVGNCQSTPCATIAYAVSQAVSGAYISLGPGTFTANYSNAEGFDLTFDGSFSGTTPTTTVEAQDPTLPVFSVDRGGLNLDNLTIENPGGTAVEGDYAAGLSVLDSTITNSGTGFMGGGVGGGTLTDSTISGNGIGVDEYANAGITITGSTIANNGVGITEVKTENYFSISSSIVSGNNGKDCVLSAGTLLDYGYNLADDNTCGFSTVNHSQSGVNPNLFPLGDYGGPTETMPPRSGSPAIDQIPIGGPGCPGADQRGVSRPRGPACDIGAVEVAPSQAQTNVSVSTSPTASLYGGAVSYQATVTSSSGTPTGAATFATGSITLCTTDALVNDSGSCLASNAPVGSDTVTGTYSGDSKFAPSSGTSTLTVTGLAPASLTLTANPNPVPNGSNSSLIAATVEDQNGNPISGEAVRFISQQGSMSNSSVTTGSQGTAQSTLSLNYTPATVTIDGVTACVGGVCGTEFVTFNGLAPPGTKAAGGSSGYWMVGSDGGVFAFGNAGYLGSLPGIGVHVNDIVGVVPTSDGKGYWMVGSDGGVFAFGDAGFVGSLPGIGVHVANIVGVVPTSDGKGYWMVGSDGGVFAFGDAGFVGSLPGIGVHVNDIVGVVPTHDGRGYWMVGSDGGVFAFGDAGFLGSLPGIGVHVNNIVGVVPTANTQGYWMVGKDGGVFAFGDAGYLGSLPGIGVHVSHLVWVVPTNEAPGYWMVGSDGGVFAFGDAGFVGSLPGLGIKVSNIVAVVPR